MLAMTGVIPAIALAAGLLSVPSESALRAQYWPWRALLRVQVISSQFDEGSFFALVDAAGIGGVGEWRPTSPKSATGSYGTFRVDI